MIKTIKGAATRQFVETGKCKFSGLDEDIARQRLMEVNAAHSLDDIGRLNSTGLHKLKGELKEFRSIDINGPWRLLFRFHAGDAYEVHIYDPH